MLQNLSLKKQEDFQQALRIIFHQLMSPIVSLRNHIINIRDKTISEEKSKLRINEMMDTYRNFLTMLGANRFFFDYIKKGYIDEPKLKNERLFDFINEKVRTYQLRAKAQKGIDIHITHENPDRLYYFRTDPELFSHVLQSLLDNAIKYSFNHLNVSAYNVNCPPSGVPNKVFVTIANDLKKVSIKIENWGCQIEQNEVEKIKRFEARGKLADKFDATGSGIGLFVADIIVKSLNGTMLIIPSGAKTTIILTFEIKFKLCPPQRKLYFLMTNHICFLQSQTDWNMNMARRISFTLNILRIA